MKHVMAEVAAEVILKSPAPVIDAIPFRGTDGRTCDLRRAYGTPATFGSGHSCRDRDGRWVQLPASFTAERPYVCFMNPKHSFRSYADLVKHLNTVHQVEYREPEDRPRSHHGFLCTDDPPKEGMWGMYCDVDPERNDPIKMRKANGYVSSGRVSNMWDYLVEPPAPEAVEPAKPTLTMTRTATPPPAAAPTTPAAPAAPAPPAAVPAARPTPTAPQQFVTHDEMRREMELLRMQTRIDAIEHRPTVCAPAAAAPATAAPAAAPPAAAAPVAVAATPVAPAAPVVPAPVVESPAVAELEATRTALDAAKGRIAELATELQDALTEKDRFRAAAEEQVNALQAELDELKEQSGKAGPVCDARVAETKAAAEKQVAELRTEVARLRAAEAAGETRCMSKVVATANAAKAEISAKVADLDRQAAKIGEQERRIEELGTKLTAAQAKGADADATAKQLRAATAEKATAEREAKAATAKATTLRAELVRVQAAVDSCQAASTSDLAEAERQAKLAREVLEAARGKSTELAAEVDALRLKVDSVTAEGAAAVKTCESSNADVGRQLADAVRANGALRKQVDDVVAKCKVSTDAEVQRLSTELEAKRKRIAVQEKKLVDLQSTAAGESEALAGLRAQHDAVVAERDEIEAAALKLRERTLKCQADNAKWAAQSKELESTIALLNDEQAALRMDYNAEVASTRAADKRAKEAIAELQKVKSLAAKQVIAEDSEAVAEAERKVQAAAADATASRAKADALKAGVARIEAGMVEKRREQSTLAAEVERMEAVIVEVTEREVKTKRAADDADARLIKVEAELRRANTDADDAIATAQAEITRLRAMQDDVRADTERLRIRGEDDVAMLQRKVGELTAHVEQLDDLSSREDITNAILLYIVKSGADVQPEVLQGLVQGGDARASALEAIQSVIHQQ